MLSFDEQRILVHNPRENVIGQDIFLKGSWEPEVTRFICPRIRKGMTILDVGADIGYYTLLFAKRVGADGRVIAFEPIPAARATLQQNILLNAYNNVSILDYALYDSEGIVVLEGPLDVSRINPSKQETGEDGLKIRTRSFDRCVGELSLDRIDMAKIDVEGAELNVLMGMVNTLEKHHPALLVEVHPTYLGLFNHDPDDLLRILKQMNYTIYPVDKPKLSFETENITIYCQ